MPEQSTPDPLAFNYEQARARIEAMPPDHLLKFQQQLEQMVAMCEAQAQRVGLTHLPGWPGVTGRPLLALIAERLNRPFTLTTL